MAFEKEKRNDHKVVPEAWGCQMSILEEEIGWEDWDSESIVSLCGVTFQLVIVSCHYETLHLIQTRSKAKMQTDRAWCKHNNES